MSHQDVMGNKYGDISELEQEEQQLIELRKELRNPGPTVSIPNSLTPEQKIAIFSSLLKNHEISSNPPWDSKSRIRSKSSLPYFLGLHQIEWVD